MFPEEKPQRVDSGKSTTKAALLSLLVPGAGEYYLGFKGRAYGFMAAEGALWTGFAGLLTQSRMLEDEYKSYGVENARIDPANKNSDFFELVGQWDSRDEYNLYTSLGQRSFENTYPETPEYYWEWEDEDQRTHYDDLRVRSDKAKRNSQIVLAAAGINRIVSIVDVIRIGTYGVKRDFALGLSAEPCGDQIGLSVRLTGNF